MEKEHQEKRSDTYVDGSGAVATNGSVSAGKGGIAAGGNVNIYPQLPPKGKYIIFLSCEHIDTCDFFKESLKKSNDISQISKENKITSCEFEFICEHKDRMKNIFPNMEVEIINRHDSINKAHQFMEPLHKNCIYIINYHQEPNHITYFQLGYAKGKGIEILGLCDVNTVNCLPEDIKLFIYNHSSNNVDEFFELLKIRLMTKVDPIPIDDPNSWGNAKQYVDGMRGGIDDGI